MNASLRQEIARLTLEERLELVDSIWDDVENTRLAPDLTPEQEALLDERYREHFRNPDAPGKHSRRLPTNSALLCDPMSS